MEYKCNTCNKLYKSYQSLWNHNNKFHNKLNTNVTNTVKPSKHNENICIQSLTPSTNQNNENCVCKYCKKILSTRQSRWRHEKSCSKNNNKNSDNTNNSMLLKYIKDLTNKITQLENKLDTKQNVVYNNIVNNGSINNRTLNVCKTGNEDINLLTNAEKNLIVSDGLNGIITLVDKLNFNERLPQHHNFYTSAINDKYVNTLDHKTNTFIKETKKELFDKILFIHMNNLSSLCKTHKQYKECFDKLKTIMFSDKYKKIFHEKVNELSYNKKYMVIDTAKLLISDQNVSSNNVTKQFEEKILEIEKMPEEECIEKCSEKSISDYESDCDSQCDSDFDRFLKKPTINNKEFNI
jgi:hypothetical protein